MRVVSSQSYPVLALHCFYLVCQLPQGCAELAAFRSGTYVIPITHEHDARLPLGADDLARRRLIAASRLVRGMPSGIETARASCTRRQPPSGHQPPAPRLQRPESGTSVHQDLRGHERRSPRSATLGRTREIARGVHVAACLQVSIAAYLTAKLPSGSSRLPSRTPALFLGAGAGTYIERLGAAACPLRRANNSTIRSSWRLPVRPSHLRRTSPDRIPHKQWQTMRFR